MEFVFSTPSAATTFVFAISNVTLPSGSAGGDIEVYIDSILVDTQTTTDFNTETVNITWL